MSDKALDLYRKISGKPIPANYGSWKMVNQSQPQEVRGDPVLVQVVQQLGSEASYGLARLKIEWIDRCFKDHMTLQVDEGRDWVSPNFESFFLWASGVLCKNWNPDIAQKFFEAVSKEEYNQAFDVVHSLE